MKKSTKLNCPVKSFKDLNGFKISDGDYSHALNVFDKFSCKTLRGYHNLYVKLDTCLLPGCFQEQRWLMISRFRLDPAQYFSLPGVAFDVAMILGDVEFEFLRDAEQYTFWEAGIRGGICTVGLRYAKANNEYMGNAYDPKKCVGTPIASI